MPKKAVKYVTKSDVEKALDENALYIREAARRIFDLTKESIKDWYVPGLDEGALACYSEAKAKLSLLNKLIENSLPVLKTQTEKGYYLSPFEVAISMQHKIMREREYDLGLNPMARVKLNRHIAGTQMGRPQRGEPSLRDRLLKSNKR